MFGQNLKFKLKMFCIRTYESTLSICWITQIYLLTSYLFPGAFTLPLHIYVKPPLHYTTNVYLEGYNKFPKNYQMHNFSYTFR